MKKIIVLFFSVIVVSFSAEAQKTLVGVMAGVNFANISSDDPTYSANMRTGFHIGGGVNLGINDNFSVNIDLLYTIRGAKEKSKTVNENNSTTVTDAYEETVTISYIEVPVLARYKLESGLYFNGGLSIAFLTSYKDEYTQTETVVNSNNTNVSTESHTITDKAGIRSSDLGFRFGLGYELESGLDIGLHYTLGLSNINDVGGWPYKYHHRVLGLTVAYWFGKS